ncbi:MAG: 1,4-alpha-glucan branching protein GlgB, partial [Clostridia bacterium]|nr:1,4-alpha-glucan branching protein GlgB [Clostridia bacterium]
KGDPYARYSRGSDDGASIVCHPSDFSWKDDAWLRYRKKQIKTSKKGHYLATPINIYELHLPSVFRHEDNSYFSYVELADKLIPYLKRMGYTHIEIMPITEYPFDPSWGYQVCCYFAPTARLGTTDDLRYFVNQMHQNGIGVIMDWVPAHFPKDEWGLFEFDGSKLYEYQGVDRMESHSWGTRFFDLGRQEVQSFLISSAVFWLKEYHFDGLRVDAVASMLYLDFDRMPGEWIPNEHGGKENLEAIAFLKKLNSAVFGVAQDVLMIAEESTSFPMITRPVADGGLGFNLKWNMGWANDFYHYLSLDPAYRKYHHQALNFPIMYAFSENYVLPISHDEVVYGKKSFLNKMHGTNEAKFLQFRAALLLMMTFPGKKMMFMGTEYGQFAEWNFEKELEWFMLDFPLHKTLLQYVMELNRFYLSHKELWEIDFSSDGFSWVLADDADHNLVAYRRFDEKGRELLIAVTFSGATVGGIKIPFPRGHQYELIFETTPGAVSYQYKTDMTGRVSSMECTLSPFSGAVWAAKDKRGEPLSKPVID